MAIKSTGLRIAVFVAGLFVCGLAAAQQVTIASDSKLLAEPNASAATVVEVKQGTTGEVTSRQGMYVQVKSAAGTGWTLMTNVRYPSGGASSAAPTPQRKGAPTSTIGIRGLDGDTLKDAQFDGKQLDALDAFAPDPATAAKGKGKK